jgi:hypothetical protein
LATTPAKNTISHGLAHAGMTLSPAESESSIARILGEVDAMFDRCEDTVDNTNEFILCWLKAKRRTVCVCYLPLRPFAPRTAGCGSA